MNKKDIHEWDKKKYGKNINEKDFYLWNKKAFKERIKDCNKDINKLKDLKKRIIKDPNTHDYIFHNPYFTELGHCRYELGSLMPYIAKKIDQEIEFLENKKIKKIHWKKEPERLEKLIKILKEENFLITNAPLDLTVKHNFFCIGDKKEESEIKFYLYWQGKIRKLIRLIDKLIEKEFIKSEPPSKLICDHFRKKDGKKYNNGSLNTQRNNMKNLSKEYVSKHYSDIDEIIRKISSNL